MKKNMQTHLTLMSVWKKIVTPSSAQRDSTSAAQVDSHRQQCTPGSGTDFIGHKTG
jgi:hypothetical protein